MFIAPFLMLAVAAAAAKEPAKPHDPELSALADLARSAPPEIGAYALIRVAEAAPAKDDEWSTELLSSAFELAAAARETLPKRTIVNRSPAYPVKVDRLSLEAAAVRSLLPRKPALARELFTRMTRTAIAPAKCEDWLIADPSDYYALVAQIANAAHASKERASEEPLTAAYLALQSITSPVEIAPAARMIAALRLTPEQFAALAAKLAAALERVTGDERAYAATAAEVERAVTDVSSRASDGSSLALALKDYQARNAANGRCADQQRAAGQLAGAAASVAEDQARKDPELERWRTEFFALAYGSGARALADAEKTGPWRDRLNDLLRRVEEWRPVESRTEAEIAAAKADVLSGAVWITPPGPDQDRVLTTFIGYLSQEGAEAADMAAWFARVEGVVRLTRGAHPQETTKVLDAYERSGNPALVLYARLERVLPSSGFAK